MKPFLRWVGGKSQQSLILERIKQLYKESNCTLYVEPFVGAMGVTLEILPYTAILNDANSALIRAYRAIQQGVNYDLTYTYFFDFEAIRERLNNAITNPDRYTDEYFLSLFIGYNQSCFNGIYRVNSSGKLNVPIGRNAKGELKPRELDLSAYADVFNSNNWVFTNEDFRTLLIKVQHRMDHFVYLDPPYLDTFVGYSSNRWQRSDRDWLLNYMATAQNRAALSESLTLDLIQQVKDLGLKHDIIDARRSVKPGLSNISEVIVRNF